MLVWKPLGEQVYREDRNSGILRKSLLVTKAGNEHFSCLLAYIKVTLVEEAQPTLLDNWVQVSTVETISEARALLGGNHANLHYQCSDSNHTDSGTSTD